MSKIIMNYNETKQTNTGAKPNNTPDDIHYGLQGVFENDTPENPEQPNVPGQPEEQLFIHNIGFGHNDYSDTGSFATLKVLSNSDVAITIDDLVAMVPNEGDVRTIPGAQEFIYYGEKLNEVTIRHDYSSSGGGEHWYQIYGDTSSLFMIRTGYTDGTSHDWYRVEDLVSELQESEINERMFRIKISDVVESDFDNLKAALAPLSIDEGYCNIECGSFHMTYFEDEVPGCGFGVMTYSRTYFSIFYENGEISINPTDDITPTDILVLPQSFINSCPEKYGFDILEVLSPFILEELN